MSCRSGYYWTTNGSCRVYNGVTYVLMSVWVCWRRISNIDSCPSGWTNGSYSGISFYHVDSDTSSICSSADFSMNGTSYLPEGIW